MSDKKNLTTTLQELKKNFGKDSINVLGDVKSFPKIERNGSGTLKVNATIGGGYPKGRVIEIYGPESSGKSTLAMHAVAEVQSNGGKAAFIDMEHAFNVEYAENLGINLKELIFAQPSGGEEALDMAEALVKTGEVDIVVVDSVSQLVPMKEVDANMGDSVMGLQARLMSQAMRKLVPVVNKSKTSLIFINQTRSKIGVVFGNPETTSGGSALKFAASIRIKTSPAGQIKDGDEVIGVRMKVYTPKNKTFPPFRTCIVNIIFGKGIDTQQEVLDLALLAEIIKKSGSWYSYNDTKLGQGENNVLKLLEDNPELYEEIHDKVLKVMATHELV